MFSDSKSLLITKFAWYNEIFPRLKECPIFWRLAGMARSARRRLRTGWVVPARPTPISSGRVTSREGGFSSPTFQTKIVDCLSMYSFQIPQQGSLTPVSVKPQVSWKGWFSLVITVTILSAQSLLTLMRMVTLVTEVLMIFLQVI